MKLSEPIVISTEYFAEFEACINLLLMDSSGNLAIIRELKAEDVVTETTRRTWLLGPKENVTSNDKAVTDVMIVMFNDDLGEWCGLTEKGVGMFFYIHSPKVMRQRFVDKIKVPIEALGFDISRPVMDSDRVKQH